MVSIIIDYKSVGHFNSRYLIFVFFNYIYIGCLIFILYYFHNPLLLRLPEITCASVCSTLRIPQEILYFIRTGIYIYVYSL